MSTIQSLHKLASPLLYKTGLYQKMWRQRSKETPFTFVVFYHRVVADDSSSENDFDIESGVPASVFEKQMRFLLKHFKPVKTSQAQLASSNAMQFAVTLDDGYEDNYLVAAPILKKLGIPATFYVVSDYVGSDRLFWWEQIADMMHKTSQPELDLLAVVPSLCKPGDPANILSMNNSATSDYAYGQLCARIRNSLHADVQTHLQRASDFFGVQIREEGRPYGLMDWYQLKDLARQGFEIGGHTATHCNVVGAAPDMLQTEIVSSMAAIENQIDEPVLTFAYPYGIYKKHDDVVTKLLAATNCCAAFTIDKGPVVKENRMFELPRTQLNRKYDFACAYNIQDTLNNI